MERVGSIWHSSLRSTLANPASVIYRVSRPTKIRNFFHLHLKTIYLIEISDRMVGLFEAFLSYLVLFLDLGSMQKV